ncbi:hypothetical protein ABPG72_000998 [Tetrahymena utriculariae]
MQPLAISLVQCSDPIDKINIDKKTYFYLTQEILQKQSGSNSNIYSCSAISEYFQSLGQGESLSLSYDIQQHNYLQVSFDYAYINMSALIGGVIVEGQVYLNGNTLKFDKKLLYDSLKCMIRKDYSKVDGKSQVSFVQSHSGKIDLKFSSDNLQTRSILGVSNLAITAFTCGQNSELNSSSLTCACKSGFTETIVQYQHFNQNECR